MYLHPERQLFYIRDGAKFIATGTRGRREAETALARYIAGTGPADRRPSYTGSNDHRQCSGHLRREARTDCQGTRADRLCDPGITSDLGRPAGRKHQQQRLPTIRQEPGQGCRNGAQGTVRKELGVLQAAINFAYYEGYLTATRKVRLPEKSAPRDRWLTRDEVARLLWAAYRSPKGKHLARFILTAIYTGTRSSAVLGLRFMPNAVDGWVDTERGVLYRRGTGEAETKKRTPPVPIPRSLLAHMRRWERNGARYVVEVDRQRAASVKTAWKRALAETGIDHCTRHDLRHTAITWAMQHGADRWHATGFFGLSLDMLERVYGHHHPDYMRSAVEAMERKR